MTIIDTTIALDTPGIAGTAADLEAVVADPDAPIAVPLYRLAHARTGDKGDRSNISLIAWHEALWPVLVESVTEAAVARQFATRHPSEVKRFLLPRLHAMNFVLDAVLDGGVNDALNLDSHGKALSYRLLDMTVPVPASLLARLVGPPND